MCKVEKGWQRNIQTAMNAATANDVDASIADFFYGCNIPPSIANHPLFKKMASKLKVAPASYKTPTGDRLTNDLLNSTTLRLKAEEAPVREVVLKDMGTVMGGSRGRRPVRAQDVEHA